MSSLNLGLLVQNVVIGLLPSMTTKYINTGDRLIDNTLITFITGIVSLILFYLLNIKQYYTNFLGIFNTKGRFLLEDEISVDPENKEKYRFIDMKKEIRLPFYFTSKNILDYQETHNILLWLNKNACRSSKPRIEFCVEGSTTMFNFPSYNGTPVARSFYVIDKSPIYYEIFNYENIESLYLRFSSYSFNSMKKFLEVLHVENITREINIDEISKNMIDINNKHLDDNKSDIKKKKRNDVLKWSVADKTGIVDGKCKSNRNFSEMFFEDKSKFMNLINKFKNKEFYPKHINADPKLGIILYGPPGTGKSFFVLCLANELDRQIVNVDMSQIKTCKQFDEMLSKLILKNTILFMDEIDCVIGVIKSRTSNTNGSLEDDRNDIVDKELESLMNLYINTADIEHKKELLNKIEDHKKQTREQLTLSHILQKLDGIYDTSDRVIVACTNHIDKIDPALLRPGRLGIKIHMDYCTKDTIVNIICHYLSITDEQTIKLLKKQNYKDKMTPSELIQNIQMTIINDESIDTLLPLITS